MTCSPRRRAWCGSVSEPGGWLGLGWPPAGFRRDPSLRFPLLTMQLSIIHQAHNYDATCVIVISKPYMMMMMMIVMAMRVHMIL